MSETTIGEGITPIEMPTVESNVTPVEMPTLTTDNDPFDIPDVFQFSDRTVDGVSIMEIVQAVKAGLRHEMDAAVADAERRLAQAREIERAVFTGIPRETVHTEDLNVNFHMIDGYTLTANSPSAGSIAWSSLHVVLMGVDYTIADGNTANKYAWFIKPGSGTTATLQTGNALPTLGPNDALIFINNGGTPVSVLESSIVYAVGPGAIGNAQLDSTTQTLLSNLQATDAAQQAQLDGAITSYYQADPPWPSGSPSPSGGNVNQGDIWYDSDNGWTYRWTGSTGSPANTWNRIADTDVAAVQAKVNTKVTTYLTTAASPPVAPSGGFTTGDMWMVTDQGNLLRRWSGSAWVDVQLGNAAISGIDGAKIGGTNSIPAGAIPTLDVSTKTSGTLAGSRVGTGVAAGNISGTLATTNIPTLSPAKLNTAFHMLY